MTYTDQGYDVCISLLEAQSRSTYYLAYFLLSKVPHCMALNVEMSLLSDPNF
jgi:hypothetical protein